MYNAYDMYVCMYVCMYIAYDMYVCMYVCMHIAYDMYVCMYVCMHIVYDTPNIYGFGHHVWLVQIPILIDIHYTSAHYLSQHTPRPQPR